MTVAFDHIAAAEQVPRYFSKLGTTLPADKLPKEIDGDKIVAGATVQPHPHGDVQYPHMGYLIPGKDFDFYVDFTPPCGAQIPLMYQVKHGDDQRFCPDEIRKSRTRVAKTLDASSDIQRLKTLKTWAFTEKNIKRLNVANSEVREIKDIMRKAEQVTNPANHVEWDRVCRYYKGYRGELHPNATHRAWSRIVYRPVIMYRAMLRTMRNPDEVGSKGTRTFWSNIPTNVFIALVIAAVTLVFVNNLLKKQREQDRAALAQSLAS